RPRGARAARRPRLTVRDHPHGIPRRIGHPRTARRRGGRRARSPAAHRRSRPRAQGRRTVHARDCAVGPERSAECDGIRGRTPEGGRSGGLLAGAGGQARRHARRHDGRAMKIRLLDIAHARSGDKGDTANVGVIALQPQWYPLLARELTRERVARHFAGAITGGVERYELPNLGALNFLLHGALGGGGTLSLKTDAQGKVFSTALLRLELDVPDAEARQLGLPGAGG